MARVLISRPVFFPIKDEKGDLWWKNPTFITSIAQIKAKRDESGERPELTMVFCTDGKHLTLEPAARLMARLEQFFAGISAQERAATVAVSPIKKKATHRKGRR